MTKILYAFLLAVLMLLWILMLDVSENEINEKNGDAEMCSLRAMARYTTADRRSCSVLDWNCE
jgi:hypothetical protein